MSIPGQTMGMAVFTDYFIEVFGLSRTQLSTAYLLGTLGSASLLIRAGRFYDRSGARISIVAASIGLGLCVSFIASIDNIAGFLKNFISLSSAWITFPLILVGYFGVRFSGQGVLTSASRNVLLAWFDRRRGLVTGARNVIVTLGFSLAPPFLAYLIASYGWRNALLILAVIVGVGFSIMALLMVRNFPEPCGLKVDGQSADESDGPEWTIPDRNPRQAIRTPVFWIYSIALALYSLFGTALVFHIVSIFNAAGRTQEEAFSYFFPVAIVSVSANMLGSWASDYCSLNRLLYLKLIGFILGGWGILHLQHDWGYWLLITGFGACAGLWAVLSNLAIVRYFGRRYLGEISGITSSMLVAGSAIGPVMFSMGLDVFGSYHTAIWVNMLAAFVVLVVAIFLKQEEPARTQKSV